jgi:predicted DsbA family dithiol-disulfide isomerase
VVTWLESIKSEVAGGLSIQWKAFSLDQQNSEESPDFMMWEHPDYPSRGIPALVAAKAAENQGEPLFLRFHLATFEAKHDEGKDIADRKVLRDIAKYKGLDTVRFKQDMAREETWQAVGEDHMESKRKYDVFGVPTLVFGQGKAVFVKLGSIPESREERISLFELICGMGAKRPYLLELKRP